MTMQPRPHNPIEARKLAVRKHTRNGIISVAGGVVGGVVLGLLFSSSFWLILGLIIAVVGGVASYTKVKKIIDHKDDY